MTMATWDPAYSPPVTVTVDPIVVLRPFAPRVLLDGRDVSTVCATPLRVTRGRSHPAEGFQPATLSLTLRGQDTPVAQGSRIEVWMNAPASDPDWLGSPGTWADQVARWGDTRVELRVFVGTVTDRDTEWVALSPGEWDCATRITATDALADLAAVPIGAEPWPQESITDRVQRIADALGWPFVIDPCTWQVAARDVDAQGALGLLDVLAATASWCGGVYQDPQTETVRFLTGESRRTRSPDLTLTAADVLDSVNLAESVSDLVNDVTVTYVDTADPAGQPEARAQVTIPSAPRTVRHETISTELVAQADAQARATGHVSHLARPGQRLTDVTLPSQLAPSRAVAEWVLLARPDQRLRLTELPAPAPARWDGYVEGWALDLWHDRYTVILALSPAAWSGDLLPWGELPADGTWADVDPACTWYDTADDVTWKESA